MREGDELLVEFPTEADSVRFMDGDGKLCERDDSLAEFPTEADSEDPLLVFAPPEPPVHYATKERRRRRLAVAPSARFVRGLSALIALSDRCRMHVWRAISACRTGRRAVFRIGPQLVMWTGALSRSAQTCLERSAARVTATARFVRQLTVTLVTLPLRLGVQVLRTLAACKTSVATVYRTCAGVLSRPIRASVERSAASARATARGVRQLNVTVVALFHRRRVQVVRALAAAYKAGLATMYQTAARLVAWTGAIRRASRASLERSAAHVRATGDSLRQSRVLMRAEYKTIARWRLSGGIVPWRYQFHSIMLFVLGTITGGLLVGYARLVPDQSVTAFVSASQTAAARPDTAKSSSVDLPQGRTLSPRPDQPPTANMAVPTVGKTGPADSVLPEPKPERRRAEAQPYRGSLRVTSTPGGAAVFINGRQVGTTPVELSDLPVGSRAVRVSLNGYEQWSRAVQVVTNRRTEVNAVLAIPRPALTESVASE